jgi:hypothetical protein
MTKNQAPDKGALKFPRIMAWIMTEVYYGRAHFIVVDGLRHAERNILASAPTFFELTFGAHADSAQLTAARIFDRDSDASIFSLFSAALREAGTFKFGTPSQVRKLVEQSQAKVFALNAVLTAARTRRHLTLAHAGAIPLVDPERYIKEGRMTFTDFSHLFDEADTIVNDFSLLFRGTRIDLTSENPKDYEKVLRLIATGLKVGLTSEDV